MLQKQDVSNAAYEENYLSGLKELDKFFIEKNYKEEKKICLSDNLSAIARHYYASSENVRHISGADVVFFENGTEIYKYRCYDDSAVFYKLIHHSNGKDYILFRRDLYGHSVLELKTLRDFHYYPACHLKKEGDETFIWCDPVYNPKNNLMAVFGCYWACPYDLVLLDFSNPFTPAENQVCISFKKDIEDILDKGYSWQKNTLVIKSKHRKWIKKFPKGVGFNGNDIEKNTVSVLKTHKITEPVCRKWLAAGNNIDAER